MKHGTLSQGKKSTVDPKTSLVRNDGSVKRTDDLLWCGGFFVCDTIIEPPCVLLRTRRFSYYIRNFP